MNPTPPAAQDGPAAPERQTVDAAAQPAMGSLRPAPRFAPWLVAGLLLLQTALLAIAAKVDSPTLNEPAHLVAGISYWHFNRFDVYAVNPPLVRMVAAAPVLLAGCKTDWKDFYSGPGARPEMGLGAAFCRANGERTFWLITLARWACIPFALLGGWVCYRWAGALYGWPAGLVALGLWCTCPNIGAAGHLITSDMASTSLAVAACYSFWRWLKNPTWESALISGAVLGVAELTKTTLVIFYPLWFVMWAGYRWAERQQMNRQRWGREGAMLVVRTVLALYVVNLGYGYEGTGKPLGEFRFVSSALTGPRDENQHTQAGGNRFAGTWLGHVPVPLPEHYILGIDLQRRDFEQYHHWFYLGGRWQKTGWWYYYLYGLGCKLPLGTWCLLGLAALAGLWRRGPAARRDEVVLLTPALVILGFVSFQTGLNEHVRYVLPILPFFFIWIGRLAPAIWPLPPAPMTSLDGRFAIAAGAALVWAMVQPQFSFPHNLSYFNELAGGPAGGIRHLIHSNLDWGQDLLFLRQWQLAHPEAQPLHIAYFGPCEPGLAGIEGEKVTGLITAGNAGEPLPPGWYAVSATLLAGSYDEGTGGDGTASSRFRTLPEVDRVGYSIHILRVDADPPSP